MTDVSGHMNSIEQVFASTSSEVQKTLLLVNENTAVMPALDSAVRDINANLARLHTICTRCPGKSGTGTAT